MSGTVFISYSRTNTDRAEELHRWLAEEVGLPSIFYDQESMKGGEIWRTAIRRGLDISFAVLVLVSEEAMKSHNVTFEWSYANGQGTYVIPLIIEDNMDFGLVHLFLTDLQARLDFVNPDEIAKEKLKERLLELFEKANIPSEIQQAAELARSPIPQNQEHAINLLEEYLEDSALNELRKLASNDRLADRQVRAAMALARRTNFEGSGAIEGLKRGLSFRISAASDSSCIEYLRKIATPESAEALKDALINNKMLGSRGREEAFQVLQRMKTDNILDIYAELLQLPNCQNRLFFIDALHRNHHPQTPHAIIYILNESNLNRDTLIKLYQILIQYSDPQIPLQLIKAVRDRVNINHRDDAQVKNIALDGLVKMASEEIKIELLNIRNNGNREHHSRIDQAINEIEMKLNQNPSNGS